MLLSSSAESGRRTVEAITWYGNDLILAGEERGIYRIREPAGGGGERVVPAMTRPDVVIVGGGVIGLSWPMSSRGKGSASTLLGPRGIGRAASWAGAGILSPGSERPMPSPAALRYAELRLHAEWAAALRGGNRRRQRLPRSAAASTWPGPKRRTTSSGGGRPVERRRDRLRAAWSRATSPASSPRSARLQVALFPARPRTDPQSPAFACVDRGL